MRIAVAATVALATVLPGEEVFADATLPPTGAAAVQTVRSFVVGRWSRTTLCSRAST